MFLTTRLPWTSSPLQVWAVEDTSVQVTWGNLPPGEVTAWVGDARTSIEHRGGPGGLDLKDLTPDRSYRIDVSWVGGRGQVETRTVASPPGELMCRIATVSDLHLGAQNWGASKMMVDRSGHEVPFAMRCAQAAIKEATEWGAELLLIKGDAAHRQHTDNFALLGDLLDSIDLPVMLIPGNHDVDARGRGMTPSKVGERGIPFIRGVACQDLPGIRVIAADTTVPGHGVGSVERVAADIVDLASLGSGPFLLGIHHQLQRYRFPTHYPLGVRGDEATGLLEDLSWTGTSGLITSGHTHRNRARSHGSLLVSEVASTRDWPGVWAGYAVHEGGIRQVVRRTAAPDAMDWHEYSRRALLGIWERWSVGRLDQRCFVHRWL
ncbi:MAG: hypothetical protein GY724_23755 [Actinomycetia bacterium]|nr:hypothetical protein [Actinomycetes bacterium]